MSVTKVVTLVTSFNDHLRDVALVAASRDHEVSVAQMGRASPEIKPVAPTEIVDNITTALGIAAQGLAATPAPCLRRRRRAATRAHHAPHHEAGNGS
ncbi:putative Abi (CAAX) family protease [Bradyrhizobium sp. USDA 4369]